MDDSLKPSPGPSRLQPLSPRHVDDEDEVDRPALHAVPIDITEEADEEVEEVWTPSERPDSRQEELDPISKGSPAVSDAGDRMTVSLFLPDCPREA